MTERNEKLVQLNAFIDPIKSSFGQTRNGDFAELYTLDNGRGVRASLSTYGAALTHLICADRKGDLGDIVLGFESVPEYEADEAFCGVTIGRFANRIANGRFSLDGKMHQLPLNNGQHHLHGGASGFHQRNWRAEPLVLEGGPAVRFSLRSKDRDQGYPGQVDVDVTYTLTADGCLKLDYRATTTAATPISLTHHSYFNLGAGQTGIQDHELCVMASQYTPSDETLIPTGEIAPLSGQGLDFRQPKTLGPYLAEHGGLDHNFVLDSENTAPRKAAQIYAPETGRRLEVYTTMPGLQIYTGQGFDGTQVGKGIKFQKYQGIALEPQAFPDSPNHANFPSSILYPGENYQAQIQFHLSVVE